MQGVIIGSVVIWRCFFNKSACNLLSRPSRMIFLWKSRSRGKHLSWKQRKQKEGIRIKKKKKKKKKEKKDVKAAK